MTSESNSGSNVAYPPADPASAADLLLGQMDDLCDNISRLQELIGQTRESSSTLLNGGMDPGMGDFDPSRANFHNGAIMAGQAFDDPSQISVNGKHDKTIRASIFWSLKLFWNWNFYIVTRIFTQVFKAAIMLTILSILIAIIVDQDLIDPYFDQYFRGTLLEGPLTTFRNYWQLPLQHEFRCLSQYFPIYKSRRHRFWDVLYSFFLRSEKGCNPGNSVLANVYRYVTCLGSTPIPSWTTDPCR